MRSGRKRRMTNVTSGSDWSDKELKFFKIKVVPQKNFELFFNEKPSTNFSESIGHIVNLDLSSADILETIDWNTIESKQLSRFAKQVLAVTKTHKNVESAVDDLARTLFEIMDYDTRDLSIHTREELQLDMCGTRTNAKPDLCIETSRLTIKLLVQEDKNYIISTSKNLMNTNPEAQVIAEAIAAFQENNKINARFDEPLSDEQLIPCITMLGTYPTFYLFNVTKKLADAVKNGEEPVEITHIERYKINMQSMPLGDAMLICKHKLHIIQCYIALRKFVVEKDPAASKQEYLKKNYPNAT